MTISNELENWARLAGFSLTRKSGGTAADMFWSSLGETRYLVAERSDGWTEVTRSDRMGPECFIFAGASDLVVERFLLGKFGNTYRNKAKLPSLARVAAVITANDQKIVPYEFDGKDLHGLIDPARGVVAVSGEGRLVGPFRLSLISVLLNANSSDIEESFRNADGSPLLKIEDQSATTKKTSES